MKRDEGSSQWVRLPDVLLQENDSIITKKATRKRRAKKSLEERFLNYTGDYKCTEWDTGKQVGKEVW